ncbi:MAG: family 78 glycoside hydrolase catalytic domain [Anaerolineales bacterium]|nr:family 78 glycoside hydrolase catalytic domain [Anaerolineales bacterium]
MSDERMIVRELRCEYAVNPIGIDTIRPRLSWQMSHGGRDQIQTAYQVLVASSPEILAADRGDQWDTGKVASGQSTHVVYAGAPLASRELCYWKVRSWDRAGQPSAWSESATFELGLLNPEDWVAPWVGLEGGRPGKSLIFRRLFAIGKQVARARTYICGLGYYELHINGQKVGDHVLDPGWTEWSETVLYVTYDVTKQIQQGANVLAVMLGNGWYGKPKLRCQVHVWYTDGSEETVGGGEWGWLIQPSPIVENSVYDGEVYDARLEVPGWDQPGTSRAERVSVTMSQNVAAPGGVMRAQANEPIKVVGTVDPVAVTNPKPGIYVFDMGQEFAGWCRLTVAGPAGTEVKMEYAESLYDDGTVNKENLTTAKAAAVYILKGEGTEIYEPRFTFFGFRYVQVTGFPGVPALSALQGQIVRSAMAQRGTFSCSNELFNCIHRAIVWTEASNLHSVPTDCPQRAERLGWMNDMTVRAEEAVYNFDIARLYTKWMQDICDAQDKQTGAIPDTAPFRWGFRAGDPVDCYLFVAWYTYLQWGDTRVLARFYDGIKGWVDFLESQSKDGVVNYTHYSDWCTPIADCYPADFADLPEEDAGGMVGAGSLPRITPGILISTAYLNYNARLLSKIAGILGKTDDAAHYTGVAEKAKNGLNRRFFHPETAQYATGSQGSNAMPLFLDLVPEGKVQQVVDNVVYDIMELHDGHLNTGNQCTKYMAEALTRLGEGEAVYTFVNQKTYPSWGYMLEKGATTIWERWEHLTGGGMNSHCHPMHGSIDAWLYKYIAGLQADPDRPGWELVHVKPYPLGDLTSADASLETMRGTVAVSWQRSSDRFVLRVTIPANSQATVAVPLLGWSDATISESGKTIWQARAFRPGVAGIHAARKDEDWVQFDVGSGSYEFVATAA